MGTRSGTCATHTDSDTDANSYTNTATKADSMRSSGSRRGSMFPVLPHDVLLGTRALASGGGQQGTAISDTL